MKKFLLLGFYLFFSNLSQAQLYGNEWINFSQDYYKIKIAREGIYRIDYNTLQSIGFPLSSINPQYIQLWINGKEQPIIVSGEEDFKFDAPDYIEFYGTYNDGKLDAPLFNAGEQPHQYMSLYSDTAVYFLTISFSTPGKRVTEYYSNNYTGKVAAKYYWQNEIKYWSTDGEWFDGLPYSDAGFYSEYSQGEGWNKTVTGSGISIPLKIDNIYKNGPKPFLSFLGHSRANNRNPGAIDIDGFNNGFKLVLQPTNVTIFEKKIYGYDKYNFDDSIEFNDLNTGITYFNFSSYYLSKSKHSLSYVKLSYPRLFDLSNESILSFTCSDSYSLLSLKNYSNTKFAPYLYDITNGFKVKGDLAGNDLKFNLPTSGNSERKYLINDATDIIFIDIKNISHFAFKEIVYQSGQNYLIITNPKLDSGATAYKTFLESNIGGNFIPVLTYTDQIYNQFYYGYKHPEALKNLVKYFINKSLNNIQYLLILGKGHVYNVTRYNNSIDDAYNLVPTYGSPPSDYYFSSGFNGSILEPLIPTGRIPARTNKEIQKYLNKLSSNNQIGYLEWKKRILQLGGGSSNTEVKWFSSILDNYYNIMKESFWGASRLMYTKNDPSAIDTSLTDKIQNSINEGYSLIDYFGHGAAEATDVSLGNPKKLKNFNKYPVFYLNGCVLGNVFNGSSLAEDYLFAENKGALGWIAGTAFGDVTTLDGYSKILHANLTKYPGKSIAQSIGQTIKTFQVSSSAANNSQCRQMIYLGEPSLKIFNAENPDYSVNKKSCSILPKDITADADSFIISFTVDNLALATLDSFNINIYQKYPDNIEKLALRKKVENIPNNKNFEFWIKINKSNNLAGLNYFTILIDSGNTINEQMPSGESNNQTTFQNYFPSNRAIALLPPANSIVNNTQVTLIAQLLSSSNNQKIIFELDTTNLFDSPKKQTSIITNSSILKQAVFSLMPFDSIDYYWRVKVDDGTQNNSWSISTFTMIYNSPEGWSQGYWQKFMDSKQDNIRLYPDKISSFLTYQSNKYDLYSGKKNPNAGPSIWQSYHPLFFYYVTNGITVTAINSKNEDRLFKNSKYNLTSSSNPWWPVGTSQFFYKYYEPKGIAKSCGYGFNTNLKEDRDSLIYFLNNVPNDHYLMVTFGNNTGIKQWEDTLFKAFEQFGAFGIRSVGENEPYTLISRRNAPPSSVFEKIPDYSSTIPADQQNITSTINLDILSSKGSLTSNLIGPASKWNTMYSSLSKSDSDSDKVIFEIYGINKLRDDSLLIDGIKTNTSDLSLIDAKKYPFIRIKAILRDSTNKTPQMIKRWTVLYDGIPEGLVNTDISNYINKDTLDEGDSLHIKIAFQNISKLNMDSILVTINEINSNNIITEFYTKKFKPLISNDHLIIDEKIPTKNKSNSNSIQIIFNPNNAQPELYAFNNSYQFNYFVINDNKNPYLDVVFDGRHITNQEIVSPSPEITITAVDENKFFFLNDPSYFKIKLKEPGSLNFRELDVTTDTFAFVPSKGPNDKSKLVFSPLNLKDGIYELSVSVRDAKGNFSSDEDYNISFRVITKSTLTNIYPYPNPFTTKTKFIFTLTGEKVPEYFKISVISVSGTVVKEITLDDLGPINIGNNITKYEWDGTDTYGDKLANGVYLYKVTAKLNGKDIELSETAGDAFFKKGYGKLYIMR